MEISRLKNVGQYEQSLGGLSHLIVLMIYFYVRHKPIAIEA